MGDYCTNDNLTAIRQNILSFGVADWSTKITEAEKEVNRIIEKRWYRQASKERGLDFRKTEFDPDNIPDGAISGQAPDTQLTKLTVYKTLELIYDYLATETQNPSGFERSRDHYAKLYAKELQEILDDGIDYDWDADSTLEYDEKAQQVPRMLYRM